MSGEQQEALRDALALLDSTLEAKSPFIASRLKPPAREEELAALRAELGGAHVPCLELWFQWHNGCTGPATDILPLGRMLSISEAIEDRRMIQKIPFVDAKRKGALKVLEDAAGDGFFIDISTPEPRIFYHMLEDPEPQDFGTMAEFVAFINEVHQAGLAAGAPDGTVTFDLPRYGMIETDYLSRRRR